MVLAARQPCPGCQELLHRHIAYDVAAVAHEASGPAAPTASTYRILPKASGTQGTWRSCGLVALLLMLASLATRAMSLVSRAPGNPPADGLLSVIARVMSFCRRQEQIMHARAAPQDSTALHMLNIVHSHLLG